MAVETVHYYLHPDGRWTDQPDGAVLRLDSSLRRVEVASRGSNRLMRPNGRGGWRPLADERGLSGRERGLVWETWRTAFAGEEHHAFRGVRAVDAAVALLLEGLTVRALDGSVHETPEAAGRVFMLSREDTRQFLLRVKDAGGEVHRAQAVPERAERALVRAQEALGAIERLVAEDRATLDEVRGGDLSGLAALDARAAPWRKALGDFNAALTDAREALLPLRGGDRTAEELTDLGAFDARATQLRSRADVLAEERESLRADIGRWAAHHQGRAPNPALSDAHRELLFREVGRVLQEQGYVVEDCDGGVRVRIKAGWLRLGPTLGVEPA
jgi:hypothetical protein